ncbi:cation:proton antiporter domain-containing protein [Microbacterium elymi]|uniref:cation:proton antiporter domain-containing protein n=1 Tax=Microbacterium elymi TaxID=2909587 RepID=UPI00338F5F85
MPFLAYLPTEQLGGSGLVAAVVAGIVTGQAGRRLLTPDQRLSDTMNWHTIELMLEGAVFLVMGLELREVISANIAGSGGLWHGAWLALSALAIVLVVRAGYVALLVSGSGRRARRVDRDRLNGFSARLDAVADGRETLPDRSRRGHPERTDRRVNAMRTRVTQSLADLDYYEGSPLNWKHGSVIVWAGMRGVVTLAAAQTLPREGLDHRALLVFVAFLVALISLMLQGFTLPLLVRRLGLGGEAAEAVSAEERARLAAELEQAAVTALQNGTVVKRDGTPFTPGLPEKAAERMSAPPAEDRSVAARELLELRMAAIEAMRARLDTLSHDGTFSTAALRHSLAELDADQLSLQAPAAG